MIAFEANPKVECYTFSDDGKVPNSPLPVVVYKKAVAISDDYKRQQDPFAALEDEINTLVTRRKWRVDWVNNDAIQHYTHYHSTAHEVLIVVNDVAGLRIGGDDGQFLRVSVGDAIAIPAGVAHRRISSTSDFTVAGLYPFNQQWDILRQNPSNYKQARENIAKLALPEADLFYGTNGPLMQHWRPSPS